ncbi:multidrug efflux SMR transporter [Gracilibacillus sp. YIM 98692]|uniref:DMT family transporter n=1 Tax=Gracilibacillus sp. YIM 98692 TaxID=2663532 RepID=UPI0013D6CB6A|nr:multidrug efflux SMR transporter [Gracilibacillus sp. YIM 98692]
MAWFVLIGAGLFEMFGVMMINQWHVSKKIIHLLSMLGSFLLSFILLAIALETLPMGTAYAIWTGIGAAGGAIVGMLFYQESTDWKRICFIALIISAVAGLKLID